MVLGPDCDIDITECWAIVPQECVGWDCETSETIGECYPMCLMP